MLNESDIYDVFDAKGVLDSYFTGYEYREGQLNMALLVAKAYNEQAIAAIEAGTGIGKSFAYLVPALLWAKEHPLERTVIATSTINLQKQLFDKDLVQLFEMMHITVPVALVVGRGNYLCPYRLSILLQSAGLLALDPQSDIGRLASWAKETQTGLRSDYPGRLNGELWSEVNSDPDICQGYRCSFGTECFYAKSKKKAADARIIITNHHLLFTDARYRIANELEYDQEAVLPPFSRLIFDEAHNLEKNATSYFTQTYTPVELLRPLKKMTAKRYGTYSSVEAFAPYVKNASYLEQIYEKIGVLTNSIEYIDTYFLQKMQSLQSSTFLVTSENRHLFESAKELAFNVSSAAQSLGRAVSEMLEASLAPEEMSPVARDLEVHTRRIIRATEVLDQFFAFESWTDDVHWIETVRKNALIHISPLSVANQLQTEVFENMATVICTSATLDLKDEFRYWGSRIGLPPASKRTYLTGVFSSPFDFKSNLLLLTPSDAPVFKERDNGAFTSYCKQIIAQACITSGGGALVLFTSYSMLVEVYEEVAPLLLEHDIASFAQGEADRTYLLNQFLHDANSVLFATDSFWEGIDAPGDALRLVIIVKLPFRLPTDPVFKARQDVLEAEGRGGFFHLALPEATMRLKQGFGRLLRSTSDKGIVLILDSRIVNKNYGQMMLASLPESHHPSTVSSGIATKIESFLYG
ncbi:MAG: ATP-dependent DNA helicase [Sphaerochaetaceae bacterium]